MARATSWPLGTPNRSARSKLRTAEFLATSAGWFPTSTSVGATLSGSSCSATIISPRGELLAYGAIVPVTRSGFEGARTTAARQLSVRGTVIKISADGPLSIWRNENQVVEV
jgi:hypothetical protein